MSTNYKESAFRHFRDAELLWNSGDSKRYQNASQLFGFSGECAMKCILVGLGLPTKPDGTVSNTKLYGHLPKLWQQFSIYASGSLGASYLASVAPSPPNPDPFNTWDVHARYHSDTVTTTKVDEFATHRTSAQDFIALLELIIEDGIV